MATPLAIAARREVQFVDCRRDDLCMSFEDFERKAEHRPRAAILVHIGGHIAFDVERIAALCRAEGIFLIEDCAHAHGAAGTAPARDVGRRGRLLVLRDEDRLDRRGWHSRLGDDDLLEFARAFRNYGKPDYAVPGLNFRMSEFTAALGLVQAERLEQIVAWKNDVAREQLDPVHPAGSSCRTAWSPGSTSTSSSTRSSARPARSTTSRATASWAARSTCPTATGWRRTTGASRSTTGPRATRRRRPQCS